MGQAWLRLSHIAAWDSFSRMATINPLLPRGQPFAWEASYHDYFNKDKKSFNKAMQATVILPYISYPVAGV